MIIDAHSHLGKDVVFDEEQQEQDLLRTYLENKVDGAIIQPFICRPYIEDTVAIHNRVAEFCNRNSNGNKNFWGMISINPHFRAQDYEAEVTRCSKQLGFVGIKIPTLANAINPSCKDGMHVFEIAEALDLPVMIHTGAGTPFADPMSAWKAIEAFRDVKVVLAHAGSGLMVEQAMQMGKRFENVYLDTSWLPAPFTLNLFKELGANKLMFASDLCVNVELEIMKYKSIISSQSDFNRIMSGTAIEVFDLNL